MNSVLQIALVGSVHPLGDGTDAIALQLGMGPGGGGWGGGFGLLWPLFWLLVLAALLGMVAYLLTRGSDGTNADRALVTLRERYARGEIEEDEFEERASRLRNRP
ncbi:SHOCT domain-containing protein [Natronococcus wangiae]|uniref:SHOCT domain-containing protein n=1 Tax=Natronococcus wangiae TaxID=3068275 RepID=UPI00273D5FF4|nr:SHOCT domain-containing protein [Natronococcus sp. AD5]